MKKYIFIILLIVVIGLLIVSYILNINIFSNNKIMENNLTQSVSASEYNPEELQDNQNKELFEEYYDKAEGLMNSMTLEEKVGQMFYVRYPENNNANNEIINDNPGGYILFGVNFKNETKSSILEKINENQSKSKIKMFYGVDEEGETVVRVSAYSAFRNFKFQSFQELWNQGGLEKILSDSSEKTQLLKSIGINMNLTPVVDVPTNSSSFIFKRAYGRGAEETAQYAKELVKIMNQDGMISTLKHFPGYGDNIDTHTGIAIDKRSYESFEEVDFLPFISGIEADVPTILVSHNIVECMDEQLPASLSSKVNKILREKLNFSGLIMTDDLAMDAVKEYVKNGEAAVQTVLSGNDMIISSDFKNQKQQVVQAVIDGEISEEIINAAVRRILACKFYYGII